MLYAYGSSEPLDVAGTIRAKVSVGDITLPDVELVVMNGKEHGLLGQETAKKLQLLKIGQHVNVVSESSVFDQYPPLFPALADARGNHDVDGYCDPPYVKTPECSDEDHP